MSTSLTPEQRFWAMVDRRGPNECWPWLGEVNHGGYGLFQFSVTRRNVRAHRFVLGLTSVDAAHLIVRHRCDNPPCCNPAHLLTGTKRQNSQDMVSRNRQTHGSRNPAARLNEDQVARIRATFALGGITRTALAEQYGVTRSTIGRVVSGRGWTLVASLEDRRQRRLDRGAHREDVKQRLATIPTQQTGDTP